MSIFELIDHVASFLVLPVILLAIVIINNPVEAAQTFAAYRLHQFDLNGIKLGSKSSAFNFELTVLNLNIRGAQSRKCLMLKLHEVSSRIIKMASNHYFGGILILLPKGWNRQTKQDLMELVENELLLPNHQRDFSAHIPSIYFSFESTDLLALYQDLKYTDSLDQSNSAAAAIFKSVLSSGYQLFVPSTLRSGKPLTGLGLQNIQGKLSGLGLEESLPSIVLVAHYDATGCIEDWARGFDSNASGVAALLELARVLAGLYSQPGGQARFNFVFLLSAGGKLNYLGTKHWLEENLSSGETGGGGGQLAAGPRFGADFEEAGGSDGEPESAHGSGEDGSGAKPDAGNDAPSDGQQRGGGAGLLNNVALVVCLEGLAWGGAEEALEPAELHAHFSKPPRANTYGDQFLRLLADNNNVSLVHKRVNLKDTFLSWEHERFSLSRLPGLTISRFSAASDQQNSFRRSIVDDGLPAGLLELGGGLSPEQVRCQWTAGLVQAVQRLAAALCQLAYQTGRAECQPAVESINASSVAPLISLLTGRSRATGLLGADQSPLVSSLEQMMAAHLGRANIRISQFQADRRDPEFQFYDVDRKMALEAHKVKPLVFEAVLSVGVLVYLLTFYFVANNFGLVRECVRRLVASGPTAVPVTGIASSSTNGMRKKLL